MKTYVGMEVQVHLFLTLAVYGASDYCNVRLFLPPWKELQVDYVLNVMAHTQKPDFVFRRNGRVHFNRRGRQFSRLLCSRGVRISSSNAGYTMFPGSVKGIGYSLHSPVSPSLPLPCVTVCLHISAGLCLLNRRLGGSEGQPGHCGEARNLLPISECTAIHCTFSL